MGVTLTPVLNINSKSRVIFTPEKEFFKLLLDKITPL